MKYQKYRSPECIRGALQVILDEWTPVRVYTPGMILTAWQPWKVIVGNITARSQGNHKYEYEPQQN